MPSAAQRAGVLASHLPPAAAGAAGAAARGAPLPLAGRVAVITGSTRGIGLAVARRLARDGAAVVVNGRSAAEGSAQARELVAGLPTDAIYVQADVGTDDGCRRVAAAAVARFGRIDFLVNNAGVNIGAVPHAELDRVEEAALRRVFDANVFGPFFMTRACVPHMRQAAVPAGQPSCCVVNVTSSAGVRPGGSSIPYSMSKAAANHLTLLMAKSQGPHVRVNAVAPSLTNTEMMADPKHDAKKKRIGDQAPLRRIAETRDVADVVAALVHLRYVTGQVVCCDGGFSLVA